MSARREEARIAAAAISPESTLLAVLLDESSPRPAAQPAAPAEAPFVAECIDPTHPSLEGRVRVRFPDVYGNLAERWVPTLHGLSVRAGDRLLLVRARGLEEPIAVGVVDGFALRPEPERTASAALVLRTDESLRVTSAEGAPLVEVSSSERGPVVRLLAQDVDIELDGHLRLSARSVELAARQGAISLTATDDVLVRGEVVRLN